MNEICHRGEKERKEKKQIAHCFMTLLRLIQAKR